MRTCLVIIDDNTPDRDDPLVVRAEEFFESVEIFSYPKEALEFIRSNLDRYMVVLLDYKFSDDEDTAVEILSKIRSISKLIPVILWTAEMDKIDDYQELINQNTNAVYSKTDMDATLRALRVALSDTQNSILEALEEYIHNLDDEEKSTIRFQSLGDRAFSLEDLFHEISQRTDLGLKFEKLLIKLTIKNLMKNQK